MAAQPLPWLRPPGSGCAAYDAWNRLAKVRIDDGDGSLDAGEVDTLVAELAYDGLGRRITKEVKNSADSDCTYHDYYDLAWRRIEVRDGSDACLKQYVWGTRYIDNIVQIGINTDPTDDEEGPQSNQCLCEDFYWPVQDANFNVVGLVDSSGTLKERYEYTPYGERTVYMKAGSDDTKTSAPLYESRRVNTGTEQDPVWAPYGLCDIGHQGLFLDPEFGLYDNRYRVLHPRFGRWLQRDPLGYMDEMGLYEYGRSNTVQLVDPLGLYADWVVPVGASLYKLVGGTIEGEIRASWWDCCTKDNRFLEKQVKSVKVSVKVQLGTGIGGSAKVPGGEVSALLKGPQLIDEELSLRREAECGEKPKPWRTELEVGLFGGIGPEIGLGPFGYGAQSGTHFKVRIVNECDGDEAVLRIELLAQARASGEPRVSVFRWPAEDNTKPATLTLWELRKAIPKE